MSDFNRHERKPGQTGSFAAAYVYTDELGNNLYRKVKCVTRDPEYPKYFYFERWEDGHWRGKRTPDEKILEGVRIVPYRLPKFFGKGSVLLCEGEKDAESAAALGYMATTSPFGHNNWPAEITPCFKDTAVYIIYDVDHQGGQWPEKIAAILWGTASKINICHFPNEASRPHEFDLTDYLNEVPSGEYQRRDKVTRIRELLR
jgi:5S rRNA maturation endonuclease (ribonuclease M5)